jgi:hypothetical protein
VSHQTRNRETEEQPSDIPVAFFRRGCPTAADVRRKDRTRKVRNLRSVRPSTISPDVSDHHLPIVLEGEDDSALGLQRTVSFTHPPPDRRGSPSEGDLVTRYARKRFQPWLPEYRVANRRLRSDCDADEVPVLVADLNHACESLQAGQGLGIQYNSSHRHCSDLSGN